MSYKPNTDSRTVQGDRNGDGVSRETGGQGAIWKATAPDESRVDVSVHGFWKWGTSALFDMRIFNLDAGSYLCQMSVKNLTKAEKDNKDKSLHPCLDNRRSFTPLVPVHKP